MIKEVGGNEVNVLIICCLAIIGIIFLCLLSRLAVHYRLNQITSKQTSILFQTKLSQFKQKEQKKSVAYLFTGTMGLIIVLFFAIIQFYQFELQLHELGKNSQRLQSEVEKSKTKMSSKNLLKEYPSSGLDLKESLTTDKETIEEKERIEKELSQALLPYIEEANLVLSSGDEATTLTILLTGSIEATNTNLVTLGQNLTELMREIEGIEKIDEVHINIVDREGNELYKGTYARNEKRQFIFQSEMRKGKG